MLKPVYVRQDFSYSVFFRTVTFIQYPNFSYLNSLLKVLALDGSTKVGKISKQWSGMAKEMFTDADNFGITCKYLFGIFTF